MRHTFNKEDIKKHVLSGPMPSEAYHICKRLHLDSFKRLEKMIKQNKEKNNGK